ncbi:hypothetical protein P5673_010023 [Acropora cervicornis]|uniref:Uncharacterized protein n=1 Tax=Acropora cervicornis TaxID=6130 RepID=A0AAD9QRF6_ACRCE|nr:hypothetical protein P5673_010023 [Acropora cervicornis]
MSIASSTLFFASSNMSRDCERISSSPSLEKASSAHACPPLGKALRRDPLNFTEDRPSRDGLHYEVVCPPVDEYKA